MLASGLSNTIRGVAITPLLASWRRVRASQLGERLARGTFWAFSGAVASRLMLLTANILVARILTRDVYGELGIIRSTVGMFVVFAGFSMGVTATKHLAELRTVDPARAGRIMSLSSIFAMLSGASLAVGLFLFAPALAARSLNAPDLAPELQLGSLLLILSAMNGAQTGALVGLEAFKAIAVVNIMVGACSLPLLVAGAALGGLHGTVSALVANAFLNWLFSHVAIRREAARWQIPFRLRDCLQEWRVLWTFSLPSVLSGTMVTPVLWGCNAMLVNQPGGFGQMGLFDAANQWRLAILFVPGMVSQVVLPMLSSLSGTEHHASYIKIFKLNLLVAALAALLVSVPVCLAAPWIMASYGPDFVAGGWVLVYLAISSIFIAMNNVIAQVLISKGRVWNGLLFNLCWAVVIILGTYGAVSRGYGAIGVAAANLFAYFLHTVWQAAFAHKVLRFAQSPAR